jgi:hypothetical protein
VFSASRFEGLDLRFFRSSVGLMQVLARSCGHDALASFCRDDLTTWSREMAELSGIEFAGFDPDLSAVSGDAGDDDAERLQAAPPARETRAG